MALFKTIQTDEGNQALSVFFETTGEFKTVEDDNENFEQILEVLEENSGSVGDYVDNEYAEGKLEVLMNPFAKLADTLTSLTDRVTYTDYMVYFDNEPVDNEIADIIIRSTKAGNGKVGALVNFMEKLYSQATSTARRNLFRWINDRSITLHPSGDFVAYKGLQKFEDEDTGETKFRSAFSGQAYVNNTLQKGQIVQGAGDTVNMPPSMVEEDENVHCAPGLHAGTYQYAEGFHRGGFFTVLINPASVVSVPKDSQGQKIRVSRYTILEATEKEYTAPVWEDEDYYDDDEFDDADEYWGQAAEDNEWFGDEYWGNTTEDAEDDAFAAALEFAIEAENHSPDNGAKQVLTFWYDGKIRVVAVEHVSDDSVSGEVLSEVVSEDLIPYKTFRLDKMEDVDFITLSDAGAQGLISKSIWDKYEIIADNANRQKSWENHPSNASGRAVGGDDTESDESISEGQYQDLFDSVAGVVRQFSDDTVNELGRMTGVDPSKYVFRGWKLNDEDDE